MNKKKIAIIGLGYVGLPLAVEFAKKRPVTGFEISKSRINELNQGHDPTLEVEDKDLQAVLLTAQGARGMEQGAGSKEQGAGSMEQGAGSMEQGAGSMEQGAGSMEHGAGSMKQTSDSLHDQAPRPMPHAPRPTPHANSTTGLFLTDDLNDISEAQIYIIAVPTPTDKNNRPDLTPLIKASETVGKVISKGDIVIYESTVYPGATEEDCIPVVEEISGLKYNVDFFAGYSPERINPGDKVHTLTTITKVTSGSTPEIGKEVNDLYNEIITAGTHLASSIKVAEAAKVIENSQRDINIAFVNELSKIFNLMKIDTLEVLEAAGTKWNFLPFRPGLVGGHCIGIDPYYLAQKAQEVGYHPEIILAGRRLNDSMGAYVAGEVVKLMLKDGKAVKGARALMLGITFKENCPDIRNTRAIDIYNELQDYGMEVDVFDPWASPKEVKHEYGIKILDTPLQSPHGEIEGRYGAIILAVAHNEFKDIDLTKHKSAGAVIFDVKGVLPKELVDGRL